MPRNRKHGPKMIQLPEGNESKPVGAATNRSERIASTERHFNMQCLLPEGVAKPASKPKSELKIPPEYAALFNEIC